VVKYAIGILEVLDRGYLGLHAMFFRYLYLTWTFQCTVMQKTLEEILEKTEFVQ
jgi:hypothetical protein